MFNRKNVRSIRNKIGVIFQNPDNQYVGTTLKDDIIFGLENHNVNPNNMDSIIEDVSALCGVKELLEKEVNKLRNKIRDLGSINIDSIEEYKKNKERYDFMSEQRLDLENTQTKGCYCWCISVRTRDINFR